MQALRIAARAPVAARCFSTSTKSAAEGLIRPDVQLFGLEGRYAHALFSAASKANSLPAVEKDLGSIKSIIGSDKIFAEFLHSPVLSRAEKSLNIEKILSTWKMHENTVNFFSTMAQNNRLANTAAIIDAFDTLMASHRNEVTCTILSASALDKSTVNSLTKTLKGFAGDGQTVKITTKIDETILGGLVVEIGDKYIDMSVKSKVQKMIQDLKQPL